jgi:hypothetical protein
MNKKDGYFITLIYIENNQLNTKKFLFTDEKEFEKSKNFIEKITGFSWDSNDIDDILDDNNGKQRTIVVTGKTILRPEEIGCKLHEPEKDQEKYLDMRNLYKFVN